MIYFTKTISFMHRDTNQTILNRLVFYLYFNIF